MNRKIDLPLYCCPFGYKTEGGDKNCDHDYPPETKVEEAEWVSWKCSKCGMTVYFEVMI